MDSTGSSPTDPTRQSSRFGYRRRVHPGGDPSHVRQRWCRHLRVAVPALTLMLAMGCTHQRDLPEAHQSPPGTAATSATPTPASRITLPCEDPIGGATTAPGAPAKLILDTLALASFPPILPTADDGGGGGLFAKVGLVIRSEHPATLSVARTDGAEIRWRTNNPGPHAATIDIPSCPATDLGTWLTYPGGFFVPRPTCVTLTVAVGERTQTLLVPVGRTCESSP